MKNNKDAKSGFGKKLNEKQLQLPFRTSTPPLTPNV